MPIITSSMKDLRRTARRSASNRLTKGKLRSSIRRVRAAVAEKQAQTAAQAMTSATPVIDRAVSKGILHRNAAARHKSRLKRELNRLTKATTAENK